MSKIILIVEDNQPMRKAFTEALRVLDYETLQAANGEEAIEIFRERMKAPEKERISLVMSDLSMPVMDGRQLFDKIRKLDNTMPFIMITGYMVNHDLDELLAEGISGWLMKPADLEQIDKLLNRILA